MVRNPISVWALIPGIESIYHLLFSSSRADNDHREICTTRYFTSQDKGQKEPRLVQIKDVLKTIIAGILNKKSVILLLDNVQAFSVVVSGNVNVHGSISL